MLEPVIDVFVANGHRDNMLTSTILELLEHISKVAKFSSFSSFCFLRVCASVHITVLCAGKDTCVAQIHS